MPHYFLGTMGCQMNQADSARLEAYLQGWGWQPSPTPEGAELALVNSCVVRQSAQDRAVARLRSLATLKHSHPGLAIALTGCLVGGPEEALRERFPYVELFFPPQDFSAFRKWMGRDGAFPEPSSAYPSALLPVIQGCNNFCTYCIVPYRRGRERSRPAAEVVAEARALVGRGARELVLLGQNVNAYGHDLPGRPDLALLLTELDRIEGLRRLRFLTSHPRDITDSCLQAVASLEKVCPSFSLPLQAGEDRVLEAMGRGYTVQDYRSLIGRLRQALPEAGVSTDLIVGFPGETQEQFEATCSLVRELRFDTVHLAGYSPRPGTAAARLRDDVPSQEKRRRKQRVEALQREIAQELNSRLIGQRVGVLAERRSPSGKWEGRTPSGKLVFFPAPTQALGQEVEVRVEQATPYWLEGSPERIQGW